MVRLEDVTARRALLLLGAFIVMGGIVIALISSLFGLFGSFTSSGFSPDQAGVAQANGVNNVFHNAGSYYVALVPGASNPPGYTQVVLQTSVTMTMTGPGGYAQPLSNGTGGSAQPLSNGTGNATAGTGGLLELSSTLAITSPSPASAASGVVALAYTVGGYVAYQSTSQASANVVIRVPASQYFSTLTKVEALGTFVSLTSNSNDVRVQYNDLNATLASLTTEQTSLLKLLNQSTNINSTLTIESQLQGVDKQINDIESQILQTRTLVAYSTIEVTITETAGSVPLTMVLRASPSNGTAPFSATFNAIVKGGTQPYVIIYNFGDGTSDQGQILIHTYTQSGDFKVTVSVTDLNGSTALATTKVHVDPAPGQIGVSNFFGTVANLFVSVVEGIVEVAAVVLPLAAVGAAVILPLRRRSRIQKAVKQSQ